MTNKNNKEELKIKSKFLINIESRTDEKKLKFTQWLSAQSNPQNSFLSLIEHCIDRFGYEDVTDHEIAKRLHTEILYFNNIEGVQLSETVGKTPYIQNNNRASEISKKEKTINVRKKVVEEDNDYEIEEAQNIIDADLNSF
ncbi:hypothetical protein [Lederbergia lenta]|uniref:hypothetical protein n=1 Tax=Lederbergia lenta TaxID=1467 RepID=UPI00203DBCA9|nr:hypothetical protein [Lederbergia lenta]MCM3113595.1 hypothetical protein [Lederbergia lenta]